MMPELLRPMARRSGLGIVRQLIGDSVSSEGLRQAFLTILFAGLLWLGVYVLWSIPD